MVQVIRVFHERGVLLTVGTDCQNAWMTPGVAFHRAGAAGVGRHSAVRRAANRLDHVLRSHEEVVRCVLTAVCATFGERATSGGYGPLGGGDQAEE
jgi:hypothetical protein